ncbi:hypothetical protein CEXT_350011 [Caerostris extrusa]|uniref:Secreted protein n=1 Tax=Caerostris extrusa TaxID=172846 RepID=A0AAV4P609_CAEEX|nr:hypothetical protein CEXT_350011 [Caerostris extrusa]
MFSADLAHGCVLFPAHMHSAHAPLLSIFIFFSSIATVTVQLSMKLRRASLLSRSPSLVLSAGFKKGYRGFSVSIEERHLPRSSGRQRDFLQDDRYCFHG